MPDYDVLCIGNAIVDIIAPCDDAFLETNGIIKGAMNLIDARRAELLYSRMGPAIEASGGSAGNTAAGVASLGGRAAYFGKVSKDHLGGIFTRHPRPGRGVRYGAAARHAADRALDDLRHPDGERSMNTYLGACIELGPEDVEADKARNAKVTYFEGYLWDPPRAKEAIRQTARLAHEARREVAMTLSDPFCVDRYRDEFLGLMRSGTVDIVFANSSEIQSLYQTESFDEAVALIRKDCRLAAVTRSEEGSSLCAATRRSWSRPRRSANWSTPPAPATFMPPASSMATPTASISSAAAISARSPPGWSSSRSGRARARTCGMRPGPPGCFRLAHPRRVLSGPFRMTFACHSL